MKNYLLFFALSLSMQMVSQEAYFYTGKNFTKYVFKVGSGGASKFLQSGSGSSNEVGITEPFIGEHFFYSVGVSLNEYNAIGVTSANSYRWNTEYLGVGGGIVYSLFPNHRPPSAKAENKNESTKEGETKNGKTVNKSKPVKTYRSNIFRNYDVLFNLGIKGSSILRGKQEIDGIFYDLMDNKEFSGILLGSSVGVKAKYHVTNAVSCSFGYEFFQSVNVSNKSDERLSFNTNQLLFGLHFNVN